MYKRILLAYDGSVEGARALREGALLARSCGAKVFLLCIVPDSPGLRLAEANYSGAYSEQVETYKGLHDAAIGVLKRMGFEPNSKLMAGEPSPLIAQVAKQIDADLVVVGHHTEDILTRWWSGSTQAYLSDHIHCSLLVSNTEMSDEAFEDAIKDAAPA